MKKLAVACLMMLSFSAYSLPVDGVDREEVPVPGDAICTADINIYGYPSACGCPEGYTYDSTEFVCYR